MDGGDLSSSYLPLSQNGKNIGISETFSAFLDLVAMGRCVRTREGEDGAADRSAVGAETSVLQETAKTPPSWGRQPEVEGWCAGHGHVLRPGRVRKRRGAEEVVKNSSVQEKEDSGRCLQRSPLFFIVNDLKEGANSMLIKICGRNI